MNNLERFLVLMVRYRKRMVVRGRKKHSQSDFMNFCTSSFMNHTLEKQPPKTDQNKVLLTYFHNVDTIICIEIIDEFSICHYKTPSSL